MSVPLRPRADADFEEIWRYTAKQWSVAQADRYFRTLMEAIDALALSPRLGQPCDDVRPGYRRRNVGSHVVFYRLTLSEDVDIVRVLHARRDFRRHLPRS